MNPPSSSSPSSSPSSPAKLPPNPPANTSAQQWLRMARAYAAEQLPWFSPAFFNARLVLTTDCPSLAAIDQGMRVYFNPALVEQLCRSEDPRKLLAQLAFVWTHEISHVLREHGERARERNAAPERWNAAADLEINDATWPGLSPPRLLPPLLPGQFGLPTGKLAEFYYSHLQQPVDNGLRDEGSGVHGIARPWELAADHAAAPAVSELEQATLRQQVAEAIRGEKRRGSLPGGWQRWAEETLHPRVDWRERLRRRTRGAIVVGVGNRLDYSMLRPHRRAGHYAPIVRPALAGDTLPRVTCVVDTSGSMASSELARTMAEVRGVLEALRVPITVIPCDARAYDPVQVLTHSDFLRLCKKLPGGGGTDMVAGIAAALDQRPTPDVVIVLTDGHTPYPRRRYRQPVLFGILQMPGYAAAPLPPRPPFRADEIIVIEPR